MYFDRHTPNSGYFSIKTSIDSVTRNHGKRGRETSGTTASESSETTTSRQERWYPSDWRYTAQGLVLCQIISYRQTGGSLAPARRDTHNKQDCPESISNIGGPWRHATMIIYQQSMTADRKQRSATKRLPITFVMCSIDLTHNFPFQIFQIQIGTVSIIEISSIFIYFFSSLEAVITKSSCCCLETTKKMTARRYSNLSAA